jgi:ATP-dependent Clp protease ATP-binding subunit ClpC
VPERLSQAAEDALHAAAEEARRRRQAVGTPHLLLGLLADPMGRPAIALRMMGLAPPQVEYEARRRLGGIADRPARRRPERSPRVDEVLGQARVEADRRSASEIEPEDILVALVADPASKAASIIKRLRAQIGVDDDSKASEAV